jgi:hypothetical protein
LEADHDQRDEVKLITTTANEGTQADIPSSKEKRLAAELKALKELNAKVSNHMDNLDGCDDRVVKFLERKANQPG